MDYRKLLGIIFILLGVIFIAFPFVSAGAISWAAGLCLISFGILSIFNGFTLWSVVTHSSIVDILLGFLLILIGFLFLVNIAALAFFVSYAFYFIGFALIFIGIFGFFVQDQGVSKWASLGILIFGIVFLILGFYSITDPLFIVILLGICLIIRGVTYFVVGKAADIVENYDESQES